MQLHACQCMQCSDVPAVEGRSKIALLWGIYIQDCYQHLLMINICVIRFRLEGFVQLYKAAGQCWCCLPLGQRRQV